MSERRNSFSGAGRELYLEYWLLYIHVYNSIYFVIFYVFWKMGGGGEAEIYLHLHKSQIVVIR